MPPSSTRFQRLVTRVVLVERQVVAKNDEAEGARLQVGEALRQRVDVFAVDLDKLQCGRRNAGVRGLDEGGFAHAASAPEQRIIGGQSHCEALGIGEELRRHVIDAFEERQGNAADIRDGVECIALGIPDECGGGHEVRRCGRRWGQALERIRNAGEGVGRGRGWAHDMVLRVRRKAGVRRSQLLQWPALGARTSGAGDPLLSLPPADGAGFHDQCRRAWRSLMYLGIPPSRAMTWRVAWPIRFIAAPSMTR